MEREKTVWKSFQKYYREESGANQRSLGNYPRVEFSGIELITNQKQSPKESEVISDQINPEE